MIEIGRIRWRSAGLDNLHKWVGLVLGACDSLLKLGVRIAVNSGWMTTNARPYLICCCRQNLPNEVQPVAPKDSRTAIGDWPVVHVVEASWVRSFGSVLERKI